MTILSPTPPSLDPDETIYSWTPDAAAHNASNSYSASIVDSAPSPTHTREGADGSTYEGLLGYAIGIPVGIVVVTLVLVWCCCSMRRQQKEESREWEMEKRRAREQRQLNQQPVAGS